MAKGEKALVIGASIGGLLAARVLSDYFEQVVVLERDILPARVEHRKGVPQSRHTHGLLAQGHAIMEDFFPGLVQELAEQGALPGNITARGRWINEGLAACQFESNLDSLLVSRPLLEFQVRQRLLALPNVIAVDNCDVLGLVASSDNSRVEGVRVLRRDPGSAEEVWPAELVVDASGRGSRVPVWLENIGYLRPPEEEVKVRVGYTTRIYRRKPGDLNGDMAVIIAPTPANKRAAALLAIEHDRWIVSLAGYCGDFAPTDEQGFLNFARGLTSPVLYELLKDAEPLGDPLPARFPASQRRRYERLDRFPAGLLVFGDALCSLNPIYGQGMTVAAMEALELQKWLSKGPSNSSRNFFRQAARLIDIPWSLAVGNDLRIPEVEGPRTTMVRFINWYVSKLHRAAHTDPAVALAFHRVTNLMASPPSILRPGVALRVLAGNLRHHKPASAYQEGAAATY